MTTSGPAATVDAAIFLPDGRVVLVRRKFPPLGWALPGGFVEVGEDLSLACLREAKEETGLDITLACQFFTYSDPARDRRRHTMSTVYIARAEGQPVGGDDAAEARAFPEAEIPWSELAFDHAEVLRDALKFIKTGERRLL